MNLSLHDIVVRKNHRLILSVPEIIFLERKLYGVVGPSGAGKSTLLKVMNLLVKPEQGKMDFFGQQVDIPLLGYKKGLTVQRQMAYVPQKPTMFDTSVFENVAIGLRFHGVNKGEIKSRVDQALQMVGLEKYAEQKATTLSGGEAQRIALARAFVLQPKLLLLDEPTSNLDPANVSIFEQVLANVFQQSEVTIIVVTHNLPQAKRISTDCLFLHQGRIVEVADTLSFFEQPQTSELLSFLSGQMIY